MGEETAAGGMRDRITDHVARRIMSGEWQPGARIPSENALTAEFGCCRMTVHHALRDLTVQGYLVRRTGSGTYVAEPSAYAAEYRHLNIVEEIAARGGHHQAEVLCRELKPASGREAETFGIKPGETLFHAIVLHHEDGVPLELENRLIAPRFLPNAMAVDLGTMTLFSRMMLVRPHREGSEAVNAVMGSDDERRLLQLAPDIPCIEIVRCAWSADGVATQARMLRPGNRTRMEGRITSAGAHYRR
jgi:GntR family histidine utilization transcriptional repressor